MSGMTSSVRLTATVEEVSPGLSLYPLSPRRLREEARFIRLKTMPTAGF